MGVTENWGSHHPDEFTEAVGTRRSPVLGHVYLRAVCWGESGRLRNQVEFWSMEREGRC